MKGANVLRLNQVTIVDAVQEYIDKRITATAGKQTVIAVSYEAPAYAGAGVFVVNIEEKKDVS